MADLTLDECRGIPEEELKAILKKEADRLFGSRRTGQGDGKVRNRYRSPKKSDSKDKTGVMISKALYGLLSLPCKFFLKLYPT